jgi:hypothetical protein
MRILMRARLFILAAAAGLLTTTCATRVPRPANVTPGTPNVTWVLMYGDRDNPDQEFACQSAPRTDCVLPASRADAESFSDIHFYYHGAGGRTHYEGTRNIGFFRVSGSFTSRIDVTVEKNQSITNQSVSGIVTPMPGTYMVTLSLMATLTDGKTMPVQETIQVTVK